METLTHCPNCNSEIKSGLISRNKLLKEEKVNIINEYHEGKHSAYCEKCGNALYKKYVDALIDEKSAISEKIQHLLACIPVVSTHSPLNWDYDVLDMVTGQSTSGTGFATEISSSISDFLGTQSERHNRKIKQGEDSCSLQIRKKALDIGGNAIVATDIDYSEMGSMKGMIMVCMSGTAIKLKNPSILGEERLKEIEQLTILNDRLLRLCNYQIVE